MNQFGKWLLPAVHFDNLHAIDNLTHQSDPLVSLAGCLHSQAAKLLSNPGYNEKMVRDFRIGSLNHTFYTADFTFYKVSWGGLESGSGDRIGFLNNYLS